MQSVRHQPPMGKKIKQVRQEVENVFKGASAGRIFSPAPLVPCEKYNFLGIFHLPSVMMEDMLAFM